jgi:hypothetical protein
MKRYWYKGHHRRKDLLMVQHLLGWSEAPLRTISEIRADVEPGEAEDTLPRPQWNMSRRERLWAIVLFCEQFLKVKTYGG